MSKLTFNNSNNQFYQSLKTSVDSYFKQNNISPKGDYRLYLKSIILMSSAVVLYLVLMTMALPVFAAILLAAVLGFTMACIGFSVMHDANHGSYSNNHQLNECIGVMGSNGLGAISFFWKQKHNIIHHTYTNVDGMDDDIAKSPIIRQCESQKWVPMHKIQHLYLTPIYALSSIFWIFVMDFTKYFTRKIYTTTAWEMNTREHVVFWLTKIYYLFVFIVLPIYVWGWLAWLVGFFVTNAAMGITLSFVFQLAHVVENTEFEHVPLDTTKHIETAWAEHQIKTTANFSMHNKVISWFVGGLNFQIEHHLFPKISHVHYPAISKIVQEKCKEFNLPYNHNPTFFGAVASHFRVMYALGRAPKEEAKLFIQQSAA